MGKRRLHALERELPILSRRLDALERAVASARIDPCAGSPATALYLDLLVRNLTRTLYADDGTIHPGDLANAPGERVTAADPERRRVGLDWPERAETMVGVERLQNTRRLLEDVIRRGVPGDVIETGVWRGGVTILMRAVLAAYRDSSRLVWVADSFDGVPPPDANRYPSDTGDRLHTYRELAIPLEVVAANFERYGLLDEQVRFLPGWFRDTLPSAPIERLALMRLDGDLYESTIVALEALYPKLSVGGYVVIDDYDLVGCRQAVDGFRTANSITAPLETVDWTGVWWRKRDVFHTVESR